MRSLLAFLSAPKCDLRVPRRDRFNAVGLALTAGVLLAYVLAAWFDQ